MNWFEAFEAMKRGHQVRRVSESIRTLVKAGDESSLPIYDSGTEPMCLAAAWSVDDAPVTVFMGAWSRVLFVPDDEQRSATDWMVMP